METRYHNIKILSELGFNQVLNTTVFKNQDNYILSPAVAKNTSGSYWFDIRKVNLNRMNQDFLLLVRIVPDLFIFEKHKIIKPLLSEEFMDNRPHSGNVWGLHINMGANNASIFNRNSDKGISVKLLDWSGVIKKYSEMR